MTEVVRHGAERIESSDAEGTAVQLSVAEFVARELDTDKLQFSTPLFAEMLAAVRTRAQAEGFSCSHYFQTCGNEQMSLAAADMLTDRYQLSASRQTQAEGNTLAARVSHYMLDYKFQILSAKVQRLRKQLADPAVMADPAKQQEILVQSMQLNDIKRRLAGMLGERVM